MSYKNRLYFGDKIIFYFSPIDSMIYRYFVSIFSGVFFAVEKKTVLYRRFFNKKIRNTTLFIIKFLNDK